MRTNNKKKKIFPNFNVFMRVLWVDMGTINTNYLSKTVQYYFLSMISQFYLRHEQRLNRIRGVHHFKQSFRRQY